MVLKAGTQIEHDVSLSWEKGKNKVARLCRAQNQRDEGYTESYGGLTRVPLKPSASEQFFHHPGCSQGVVKDETIKALFAGSPGKSKRNPATSYLGWKH
jgi:hypothetical protein